MASPNSSSNFQIILTIVFVVFAVLAVLIFSGIINIGSSKSGAAAASGNVVVWGTLPESPITRILTDFNQTNKTFAVNYVKKDASTIDSDLVQAVAFGNGPDMVVLPNDKILKYRNLIEYI